MVRTRETTVGEVFGRFVLIVHRRVSGTCCERGTIARGVHPENGRFKRDSKKEGEREEMKEAERHLASL